MDLSGIVAVVRMEVLAGVERVLRELGVKRISVSKTKGYVVVYPVQKFFKIPQQSEAVPDAG